MNLFLTFLALVSASQCLSFDDSQTIRSAHYQLTATDPPGYTPSMSPAEMKVFSGHALNLVKARCPAVDVSKILRIQRYIAKRITELEPKKYEHEEIFDHLLGTVRNCSEEAKIIKKSDSSVSSDANAESHKKLFASSLVDDLFGQDSITSGVDGDAEISGDTYRRIRIFTWPESARDFGAPETPDATPKADSSEEKSTSAPSQETEVDTKDTADTVNAGTDEIPSVPEPSSSTSELNSAETQEPTTEKPKKEKSGFVAWISSVWTSVSSFFSDVFGGTGLRFRRTVNPEYNPIEVKIISPGETKVIAHANSEVKTKPSNGKVAFASLFDEVCNIYCKCETEITVNFKFATKDLLQFLFTNPQSLDHAAAQFIDDDLIQELKDCV